MMRLMGRIGVWALQCLMVLLLVGMVVEVESARAANTQGLPSRPQFQRLGIGVAPSPLWAAGQNIISGGAQAAIRCDGGYTCGFTSNLYFDGTNWRCYVAGNGAGMFLWSEQGTNTPPYFYLNPATDCTVNGQALSLKGPFYLPRTTWGTNTATGATCTIAAGSQDIASCTWSATGQYSITFNYPYDILPTCTATEANGALGYVLSVGSVSTTGLEVYGALGSGTANNVPFSLVCVGT